MGIVIASVDGDLRRALLGKYCSFANADLLHYARLKMRSRSGIFDAEDVVQETFLEMCRQIKQFHAQSDNEFSAWGRHIAFNSLKTLERSSEVDRRRANDLISLEDLNPQGPKEPETRTPSAEAIIQKSDRTHAVRLALKSLSRSDAMIIILVYMKGYSVERVSSLLRITPNAVYKRLHSAREKLASFLVSHPSYRELFYHDPEAPNRP